MTGAGYERPAVGPIPLWFSFLAGPAMWTLHLLASYPLVDPSCGLGSNWLLNLITAATAAGSAAAAVVGWWAWRRVRGQAQDGVDDATGRARFMAISGAVLSAFFTFVIIVEGLPPMLQDPCARGI